jgi:hypothetical protein
MYDKFRPTFIRSYVDALFLTRGWRQTRTWVFRQGRHLDNMAYIDPFATHMFTEFGESMCRRRQ